MIQFIPVTETSLSQSRIVSTSAIKDIRPADRHNGTGCFITFHDSKTPQLQVKEPLRYFKFWLFPKGIDDEVDEARTKRFWHGDEGFNVNDLKG